MTKEEAEKRLQEHSVVNLVAEGADIEYRDELSAIGINLNLIEGCLHQIDYYRYSIGHSGEYHLAGELDEEQSKIRKEFERVSDTISFDLEYEID